MEKETPGSTEPPSSTRIRQILSAAEEVFAEHGFAGARVDEIARRAGVNKAMLYYHVGDKAALYELVLTSHFQELAEQIELVLGTTDEPRERLARIQAAFAAVAQSQPHFPQIMLREFAGGARNMPPGALEAIARFIATTRRVVEEGRDRGVFRRDVDPFVTHILVVGGVIFAANARRVLERFAESGLERPAADFSLAEIARSASEIILNGITLQGEES